MSKGKQLKGREFSSVDNSRAVALFDRKDGSWNVRFRNEAAVTSVRLSTEAVDALVSLYIIENGAEAALLQDGRLKFARTSA